MSNKDIFNIIALTDFLKEEKFARLITKWAQEWNSVVYFPFLSPHRDDLLVITHNRSSEIQLDGISEESIVKIPLETLISIFLIEINPITSNTPYCATIYIRWLFDRRRIEFASFIDLIQSNRIISLIQTVCQYNLIDFSLISTIYLLFPCVREIELLIPCFPSDVWSSQRSYAAECIEAHMNGVSPYRDIYHMIWQNPRFKSDEIPTLIRKKMLGALALYHRLHPKPNHPCSEDGTKIPIEIYNLTQQYQIFEMRIRKKLKTFRKWQKVIWGSLVIPLPFLRFAPRFANRVLWISHLMQHFGFRLRYCETNSPNALNFFRDNRNALLMTLIECVPTEGSPFSILVDDNGRFNDHLLNPEILKQWFGSYMGVLEFNMNPNPKVSNDSQWIFAGTIYGGIRKRPSPFIRSFSAAMLLPEIFRGYGLGGMLIQLCTYLMDSLEYCDEVVEVSTENNHAIKFLMKRFRFFKYGNISNSIYNIKALIDKSQPLTLGFQQMTWYSNRILNFLSLHENDPQRKRAFANAYQIMVLLRPYVKKFHDRRILIKFE